MEELKPFKKAKEEKPKEEKLLKWLVIDSCGVNIGIVWSKDEPSAMKFAAEKFQTEIKQVVFLK